MENLTIGQKVLLLFIGWWGSIALCVFISMGFLPLAMGFGGVLGWHLAKWVDIK